MALPDLIPLDVLFGNPERRAPALSPDGSKLAYLAPVEGVLNIWVGSTGLDDAKPVTTDEGRGVRQYWWAKDGQHLLYLQDTGGDENWRLHTVDLKEGTVVDRTPFAGVQARIVGLSSRVPDQVLVGLNRDDPRFHDVYRLHLASGTLTKELTNPGFDDWLVDHSLTVRGGIQAREDGGVDYMVRDGEGWRVAWRVTPEDNTLNSSGVLGFDGQDRHLWIVETTSGNTACLSSLDLELGQLTVVARDDDRDLLSAVLHPQTFEPQLAAFATDRWTYRVLDETVAADVATAAALDDGDLHLVSRDEADRLWVLAFVRDRGSPLYFLFDRDSGQGTRLFEEQPKLAAYELAEMVPFAFTARDGLTIHGFATFPPGVDADNLPAVVSVHGGPWGARHSWGYVAAAQWLANRGYVCLEINYRGSGGYGRDFINASAHEWAGRMHDDLIDGLEWAIAQGWVDRDRVGIFGGSYGGYAALVGATFTPDVFRCAIDIVGPSNLVSLLETIPPYWVGIANMFYRLLGHPERDRDFLWQRSPLSRVDQIKIPMLIGQGANDPRVKQAESEQIVAAMVKAGIPHEYILFADEGHGFAKPENMTRFNIAAENFLAEHLGGRAEGS